MRLIRVRIALEALLLLVLAMVLFGRTALAPERLKGIAASAIEERTGLELLVEGASYDFPLSVSLVNAYLVARGEGGISVLASARRVDCTFGFREAPRRRLGITRVSMHEPRVFLERAEDGTWNFSPAQRRWAQTMKAGAPGELIDFVISGGVMEIVARGFKAGILRARLKDIQLKPVKPSSKDDTYDFEAECVERMLGEVRAMIDVNLEESRTVIDCNSKVDLADVARWLPAEARGVWDKFSPRGRAGASFSLTLGPSEQGFPDFSAKAELDGCSVNYQPFPYDVSDLRGTVRANLETVTFEQLHGNANPGDVVISGDVSWSGAESPAYSTFISAKGALIDQRLRNALPEESQRVWDQLKLQGGTIVNSSVQLKGTLGAVPAYNCMAAFRDAAICYSKFPLPVDNLQGTVDFSNGLFQAKDIIGTVADDAESQIAASATAKREGEDSTLQVDIVARNVPIDRTLKRAVGGAGDRAWAMLSPEGRISGDLRFNLPAGSQKPDVSCTLDLSQVSVSLDVFPYRFDGLHSEAHYAPGKLMLTKKSAEGQFESVAPTSLSVEGKIEGLRETPSYDLKAEIRRIALDHKLRAALPQNTKSWWDTLSPSGQIDATLQIAGEGSGPPREAKLRANLHDCALSPFAVDLNGLEGAVTYEEGMVSVEQLQGNVAEIAIDARGRAWEEDGEWQWRCAFQTGQFTAGDDLRRALPPRYARIAADYLQSGTVSLGGSVRGELSLEQLDLSAQLEDVSASAGVTMTGIAGNVFVAGDVSDALLAISGRANLRSAQVNGWHLSNADVAVDWSKERVSLREIEAEAYNGKITGDVEIDHTRGQVDANLRASSVDLQSIVRDKGPSMDRTEGLVDIDAEISASLDGSSVSGEGKAVVTEGYLWELPLFTALLKILPLKLDELTTFSDGLIEYVLETDKIEIKTMEFTSAVLSIDGAGSVGYDRTLDLTLALRPTSKEIPLPLLGGLVEELLRIFASLERSVLPFKVEGTFSEPDVSIDLAALPKGVVNNVVRILEKLTPRREESE